ncbi:MAG: hypothetical protein IJI66_08740 [Erysipelotrichaceae bacterium]|nr:hypothetical protein [Erysipelotrichaceae bacterium]
MRGIIESYKKFFEGKMAQYGNEFGFREYFFYIVGIMGSIIFVGYVSKLNIRYMIYLGLLSLLIIPVLIVSIVNQRNEQKRFEMVASYLTSSLPIFVRNPKILYTLEEVSDLIEYRIQDVVFKAIDYIKTNITDVNAEETALAMIEKEFPNSRITATHKLMLSIEAKNSKDYEAPCLILYDDVENWINRVYEYQKDLKNRRTKLIMLTIMTIFMNCMFIWIYNTNEAFSGFENYPIYQISTFIFLLSMLVVLTLAISKLHGAWIVNDSNINDIRKAEAAYNDLKIKRKPIRKGDIIISIILLIMFGFCAIYLRNAPFSIMCLFGIILVLSATATRKANNIRRVGKAMSLEFPAWLRTVSINLKNMTVMNAIDETKQFASSILREEIDKFEVEEYADPISIRPYVNFLKEYDLPDVTSSMKVLYSIQNLGAMDVQTQISGLITRTQRLLEKSEKIRNEDNLNGIELLGFIPMGLFTAQTLVSLFLMMQVMMTALTTATNI